MRDRVGKRAQLAASVRWVRERRSTAGFGKHALEGRARLREERYVGPVMAPRKRPQGARDAR